MLVATVLLGCAVAAERDPSADGPFAVGVTTRTFVDASRSRMLVTEIWYPAVAARRDARPRRGRRPLVLLAHGLCGSRTNYEYLSIPLAARGFVVAAPDFPAIHAGDCGGAVPSADLFDEPARDLVFLHATLRDRSGPAGALARAVRGRRVGLVGHSLGGFAVLRAAIDDPDVVAAAALAPFTNAMLRDSLVGLDRRPAVLLVVGTADPLLASARTFFAPLHAPAFRVEIAGGTHDGLSDMDAHLAPDALAHEEALARRYTVALLERYLARDRRFARFLTPADAAAQGTDATLAAAPG
jgi:predicted dienelactone hydrolase